MFFVHTRDLTRICIYALVPIAAAVNHAAAAPPPLPGREGGVELNGLCLCDCVCVFVYASVCMRVFVCVSTLGSDVTVTGFQVAVAQALPGWTNAGLASHVTRHT